MDPISLAVGAGIAAGFFLAGHISGRVATARRKLPSPPEVKPICGCRHHRSMHDSKSGECHEQVDIFRGTGARKIEMRQCECRQYVGPEPITSLWTPPVLPEGSDR